MVHLARRIDGVVYTDRGSLSLKGIAEPVRVVRVAPERDDPAERLAALAPKSSPPPRPNTIRARLRRRPIVAGAVAFVVLAAALTPILLNRKGSGSPRIEANAVGLIDLSSERVTRSIPIGTGPDGIVGGFGSIWAANSSDGTVSRRMGNYVYNPAWGVLLDQLWVR